jgi:sulfite reductase (NADPH) hemoprotein beta-component
LPSTWAPPSTARGSTSSTAKLYRQDLDHDGIVAALRPPLLVYAKEREDSERFGDFAIRTGAVKATTSGLDFHAT